MSIIFNPGSENTGGTYEQALINAKEWYENIIKEFPEVEMNEGTYNNKNWTFIFKHKITGQKAELNIHGFTKEECEKFVFHPRVYWNGSSTADPKIEDWLTDNFTYRILYEPK